MTFFINPGPDLSANTFYVVCDSLFDFSIQENETISVGDSEIKWIRTRGEELIQKSEDPNATVGAKEIDERRRSQVSWLDPNDSENYWLIKRLADNIAYFNALHWNFDLTGFVESCQYTVYNANQLGHYDWHLDLNESWDSSPRKLSTIIQLSSPDEYEGGEVCIKAQNEEIVLPKEKGSLILFPSYILHKVSPVTKGVRRSLVSWISGPKFR